MTHLRSVILAIFAVSGCAAGAATPSPEAPREGISPSAPSASASASAPIALASSGPSATPLADAGAPVATACGATAAQTEGRQCPFAAMSLGEGRCAFPGTTCRCMAGPPPCQGTPTRPDIPTFGTWRCVAHDAGLEPAVPRPTDRPCLRP